MRRKTGKCGSQEYRGDHLITKPWQVIKKLTGVLAELFWNDINGRAGKIGIHRECNTMSEIGNPGTYRWTKQQLVSQKKASN